MQINYIFSPQPANKIPNRNFANSLDGLSQNKWELTYPSSERYPLGSASVSCRNFQVGNHDKKFQRHEQKFSTLEQKFSTHKQEFNSPVQQLRAMKPSKNPERSPSQAGYRIFRRILRWNSGSPLLSPFPSLLSEILELLASALNRRFIQAPS